MEPVFNFIDGLAIKAAAGTSIVAAPNYAPTLQLVESSDELPLAAARLRWSVEEPPSASLVPVIGRKLMPVVGDFVRSLNAREGDKYSVTLRSSPYDGTLMTGYVTGQAATYSAGGMGSAMSVVPTVTLGSSLARLAAYTPYNRVFVGRGTPTDPVDRNDRKQDNYNSLDPAIFRMAWLKGTKSGDSVDILRYCRELLNEAMNLKEDEALAQDVALDLLESPAGVRLRTEVVPATFVDILTKQMQRNALNVFGRGNGMRMMRHLQQLFFFYLVPKTIQSEKFRMLPLLPMGKAHDAELTKDKILSMQDATALDVLPVDRVWVPIQRPGMDFQAAATPRESVKAENFHVYPRGASFKEDVQWSGTALLMDIPPPFLVPEMNKYAQHGARTDPDEVNLAGHALRQNPKSAVDHKLEKDPVTREIANDMGDRFAKMYYAKEAFKTSSMRIGVAWHDFEEYVKLLGGVFKLSLPQLGADGVEYDADVYFGQLTSVDLSLSATPAKAECSLTFEYVRNQAVNDEHALEEHPLYENWTKLSDYVGD